MITILAGMRRQRDVLSNQPDYWMTLATTPLLAVVFIAIVQNAGRPDLLGHAVLAPGLFEMWSMSLYVSGEIVARDRDHGLLENTLATPSSYALVTVGRVAVVTVVALLGFVESWLVALIVFGVAIPIPNPLAFIAGVLVSAFAMTGTALMMAGLFVRSTSVRRFQNSLSYPFYVLGGIIVPVTLLPAWVQPFSRVVFLSWSSDLLRDSLNPFPVEDLGFRLSIIVGLGLLGYLGGVRLIRAMIDRVRTSGEVGFT